MKIIKTNAMRLLDQAKLSYDIFTYDHGKEAVDGMQVATLLHQNPEAVFKTLVTIANTKEYFVFVIPVAYELDLKKCAKAVGVKSIEMIHVKDITKLTGYVRGGCSPIGMKKQFKTVFHNTCLSFDLMMFSAGKIGLQLCMSPLEAISFIHASCANLIQEKNV